jgi:hypothetical protein
VPDTLAQYVAVEPPRAALVAACARLVDEEVRAKSGFSGIAIKGAYAAVKAIKPGFVEDVIDALFDEWVGKMEGHFTRWRAGGQGGFASFVAARAEDVAEDLLAVTDGRAKTTKHRAAAGFYDKLRPAAKKNVAAAVPKLGGLMEPHIKPA